MLKYDYLSFGVKMKKNILITGCSSGLGLALTKLYLQKGYKVFGISRSVPKIEDENFIFKSCDLSVVANIKDEVGEFIKDIKELDLVYLNAGMLGVIKSSFEINTNELHEVYNLNVYANKELLDTLATIKVKTIVGISSGAAKNGSKGWAAYSLSKAGLNMLFNLYAKEMTQTKLLAVAPGVIETPMTDVIRFKIDDNEFPSAKRLKAGKIMTPDQAALRMDNFIQKSEGFESGSFVDVRDI